MDTETKEIRLDVIKERNSQNLKTFVYKHIEAGSHLIHYGLRGYTFLDSNDSVYSHGAGNFGQGTQVPHILNRLGAGLNLKLNFYIDNAI